MNCSSCGQALSDGYIYLRGFGAALHWGERPDVSWLSRKGLEVLDLRDYSIRPTGTQATIRCGRCSSCGALVLLRAPETM